MKDPLQQLWDLYEDLSVQDVPELQPDPEPSGIGTPQTGDYEHPVIQQRKQVDKLRQQGMSDEDAHQQIYGEVELSDPKSKADFAATLARVQQDAEKKGVKTDDDADFKSLLARDKELESTNQVSPEDLKTPMNQEVDDETQSGALDTQEEIDYNLDVAYLQQYGRA
jgi:hypothetical protein